MNTIPEVPLANGKLNGAESTTTNKNSQSSKGNVVSPEQSREQSTNGSSSPKCENTSENLKIIGHLKNIEKINETRRVFLNNTISEYSSDEKTQTIESTINDKGEVQILNEQRSHKREQQRDSASNDHATTTMSSPLLVQLQNTNAPRSPTSPPPKPPMLSRTRSIGAADNHSGYRTSSPVQSPPTSPFHARPNGIDNSQLITSATIKTAMIPEPSKVTTIKLEEDTPVLRHVERYEHRPISVSPDSSISTNQISVNHYERLIEELKCPGCASPMKSPVYLCQTGHSVCEQCTRVLIMCPLCKEPFTKIRSLTVEALCSKAHFRCANASGGCTVRLQIDLLGWHEKQCIYKPMKCFMGRVWGDCQWSGREAFWKEHLEREHGNKVFTTTSIDLIWNMGVKQKPLTGYYVFEVFEEMFNFYEVYDKDRVLFTMTCTSSSKQKKHQYAYEVTILHEENEALAITHKFPVHSEYDSDILAEGTCVSVSFSDLAKFIDEDKLLHYRVRVMQVTSPRKSRNSRHSHQATPNMHPIDFQQTQIQGVNLKSVPSDVIVTRQVNSIANEVISDINSTSPSVTAVSISSEDDEVEKLHRRYIERQASKKAVSDSESDPEFEAFIAAKQWGTPQMNFNRKFLKNHSSSECSSFDERGRNGDTIGKMDKKFENADKVSITSTNTSYKKRMTNSLRKSFRSLKTDLIDMRPFAKKNADKNGEHKKLDDK